MSRQSLAKAMRLSLLRPERVLMLWSLSASLMRITLRSFDMAKNIFLMVSASWMDLSWVILEILVTAWTISPTSFPKSPARSSSVVSVSSRVS